MAIHHVTFCWPEICLSSTQKRSQYKRSTTHAKKKKKQFYVFNYNTHTKKYTNPLHIIVCALEEKNSQPELTDFQESDLTVRSLPCASLKCQGYLFVLSAEGLHADSQCTPIPEPLGCTAVFYSGVKTSVPGLSRDINLSRVDRSPLFYRLEICLCRCAVR